MEDNEEQVGDLFQIDRKGAKEPKSAKKKKILKRTPVPDDQEHALEEFLFGPKDGIFEEQEGAEAQDRSRDELLAQEAADEEESARRAEAGEAVWHDDDDDKIVVDISGKNVRRKLRATEDETTVSGKEYAERLRKQLGQVNKEVSWATRKKHKKTDAGDELLKSSKKLLGSKTGPLPSRALDIERLKDANVKDVSDAVIQSCRFHPSNNLMLTAGLDKRLKLFQVDGKDNAKVQGVFFEDLPITTAEFTSTGEEIFVSGRRPHFYVYDLAAAALTRVRGIQGRHERDLSRMFLSPDNRHVAFLGEGGNIALVSRQSRQWIGDLRMNQDAYCAAFGPDGHTMYSAGQGGLMYHWDLRMHRCVRKVVDEGSLSTTSLALSATGSVLAAGSNSGVVNLYDPAGFDGLAPGPAGEIAPTPRKALMNLSTRVSLLKFNPDAQILVMGSQLKKGALRVAHVGSGTVFSNWPTSKTPLNYVSSADISSSSSALAMGNDRGKVLLYRFIHYS